MSIRCLICIIQLTPSQVAALAVQTGDPTGKYAAWLAEKDPAYPGEAFFFFEQVSLGAFSPFWTQLIPRAPSH